MNMLIPAVLLGLSALSASAADWPRWRGPANDGHLPAGSALPSALPTEAKIVWRKAIGDGMASPVVADGRVYVAENRDGRETARSLAAGTGADLWSTPFDEVFSDHLASKGPRCAPVADGDRVYVQSCRGELRCLDAATGKIRWGTSYVTNFGAVFKGEVGNSAGAGRHGYSGAPLIDGDRLYAGVGGANGAGLVCFDKKTGAVIWKALDDIPAYTGPALATIGGVKQVLLFAVDGLAAVRAEDGQPLWRSPVKTSYGRHVTAPVVLDNVVVVSSHQAGLTGIRVTKDGDGFRAGPAWTSKEAAINFSNPVAVGDHLYGLGPARKLVCVDIRDGSLKWSRNDFSGAPLTKEWLGLLASDNRLLALADNGRLVLFAADPTDFKSLGTLPVCGKTWCNPALADGRLYLRDEKELMCVEVGP